MKKTLLSATLLAGAFLGAKAQIGPCAGTPVPVFEAQYLPACAGHNDTIYANAFLNKGLVAYYPFNGNANDLSGNGYDATTNGVTLATDRFGNANKCYNFAGTGTYIQCPPAAYFTGGSFTISGWVNVTNVEAWGRLIDFGNGAGSDNVLVALNGGGSYQLLSSSTGQNFQSSQTLDNNTWVQVLFTYNVNTGYSTCYYNGVAIDSGTVNQPNNVIRNNAYIGLSDWSGDGGVFGMMDDIRIYNRNLSSAEVSQLYNYESTGESQTAYSWSGGATTPYLVSNTGTPTTVTYTLTQTRNGASCSASDTFRLATVNCTAALNFDGNDDFVDVGNAISTTNGYTKEAWVYATDNNCHNIISSLNAPMWLDGGNLSAANQFNNMGVKDVADPNAFPTNVWTHVALTYDAASTTMVLYVNGNVVNTNTSANAYVVESIEIGAYNGTNCPFIGSIDEVMLWNTARTQAQIQKDMNCKPVGVPAGLAAYYNFDQGVANQDNTGSITLSDITGNGNDGTLNNFALIGTTSNWVDDANQTGAVPSITSVVASNTLVCSGTTVTLTVNGTATNYTWGTNAGSATTTTVNINPTATATYVVTAANNNCKVMDSVSVSVNPLPNVVVTTHTLVCVGTRDTLFASGATNYIWTPGGSHASFISGIVNTQITFTLTGTDANGCTNDAVANIAVNALPNVQAMATNTAICTGGATTLSGTGAVTYTWTGGVTDGTPFNPTSTDTYTVIGTDANGCKKTNTITITVNQLPMVTGSATNSVVCEGSSTTLMGAGAATYTWTGGVTDNIAFVPTATDTYSVTGTDANGCVSASAAVVSVTVNPAPNVTASATNSVICMGDATTLMGGGADTYTWTGGVTDNVAFNPTATDTYTVTGTENVNNCTNTAVITVTVNSLPTVTVNDATVCAGATATLTASGANTYTWSTTDMTAAIAVTPTANASYSVNATDVNGCMNMATANVTVNSLPTINVTWSPVVICAGVATTFTASGANTYTWSTGDLTATTQITSNAAFVSFTVTGADANNCQATTMGTASVMPTPTITATTSTVSLCAGQTATLTASGATTYTWSTSDNTATTVINPTVTATYTVMGTDGNGCENMTTITQTVTICAGIASYNNQANINVYPNPSTGVFTIDIDVDAQLVVTNALGEVVISKTVSAGTHDINIENKVAGVYFVHITQHNNQQTIKLIKN